MFRENRNQIIAALNEQNLKDAAAFFEMATTPPKGHARMDAEEVEKIVKRLAATWQAAHSTNGKHEAAPKAVIMQILGPNGNAAERHSWNVPAGAKLSFQVADEASA